MKIIAASIDLLKIDKSKIKYTDKGQAYYSITIIENDQPDKFGQTHAIATGLTKEEREAKQKQTFIGNGKTVYEKKPESQQSNTPDNGPAHNPNYDPNLGF